MKINFRKYRRYIITIWALFFINLSIVVFYIYAVNSNIFDLFGQLPSTETLENPKSELSSELYSADGILLGKYFRYNRSPISFSEISPNLINALLATEDWRYFNHSGIDLKGILRALILSIVLRKNRGGGSTISQQLAKNLFKTREDKFRGKLGKIPIIKTIIIKTKEWIVAVKLEKAYTKEEIIGMYLNTVSFGSNTFGIKSAAATFFNESPERLSINQSAILIGLLRAPTKYSPVLNPTKCITRKNTILHQMYKNKFIEEEELKANLQKGLELKYEVENHHKGIAPYFRAIVKKILLIWTKKNGYDLHSDGLKIYTTLDTRIQKHAEDAMKEHMTELQEKFYKHWGEENPWIDENGDEIKDFLQTTIEKSELYRTLMRQYDNNKEVVNKIMNTPYKTQIFTWEGEKEVFITPIQEIIYNKKLLRAGLMALDPKTGDIKAWVGGINFKHFKYDHVLQGKRQPGSAFKPFVYATALEHGFEPDDVIYDIPVTFKIPGGTWTPQNWHKTYTGEKMTLRQALARSINSATAYLLKKVGPKLVVEYAKKLGIQSKLDPVPSICLGISDVSLYELLGAYNTFSNKGIWTKPMFITRIEDRHGNVIKEFHHKKREALNEKTASKMLYLLRGAQEEMGGSAKKMDPILQDIEIASKSGTTQNQSDGLYIGLTPQWSVVVWVGGDERCIHFRDFANGQSGKTAKPFWVKFMIKVYSDPDLEFTEHQFSRSKYHISEKEESQLEGEKEEDTSDDDINKIDIDELY